MCGITGILKYGSSGCEQEAVLRDMTSTLVHRGPDGWGMYLGRDMALGHTRLSIVDLAGGHQPMMSGRFVISYNGEIYNYIEIRKELEQQGVTFATTSDTEVVLKAYEYYGTDAFQKFNGQFAILIWDRIGKTLTVARDRFGIRPLFILEHRSAFYFSSEMKAFDTLDGFNRSFDIEKLYDHALLWNSIGDDTIYNNIRSLPEGTFEVYEQGRAPTNYRYYEIGESEQGAPDDIDTAVEEFTDLLNDSVRLRLRSDVEVGAYLSGGIDSSVITHLTSIHNNNKFKTFSVTFDDHEFDESSFQQQMVSCVKSEHFAQRVNYKKINDHFADAVYHFERPVFRTAGIPLYLLSNTVRQNDIKVVLTGEGADEILFGYDSFKELKLLDFWGKFPESSIRPQLIRKLYPHLSHYSNPKQFGLMKMYYKSFLDRQTNELAGLNVRVRNNQVLSNYFNKDFQLAYDEDRLAGKIEGILPANHTSWSRLQQNQFLEMKTLLSGYLLSSQGDRMSLSHGVEGRYPFLDHRLVEKIFYYKDRFKLNGFSQKFMLGKAFGKNLPSSIINRPKKPYTAPDLKSFFHSNALSEQAAYFLSDELIKSYGLFDAKYVNRIIKKFSRDIPAEIGYRDNMLISFILSAQIANYWSKNPKTSELDEAKMTVLIKED